MALTLFFDSGVGGLSYLEGYRRRHPAAPVAYLADTAGFPYGEKDPDELRERIRSLLPPIVRALNATTVVLACNTASVVALSVLRTVIDVPVIGVVPAVKPAAQKTQSGHIAILATSRTAHDPYTDDLVASFAEWAHVTRLGLPETVRFAEAAICSESSEALEAALRSELVTRLDPRVDTVVLACTHFVRHRAHFERLLPGVTVVDSLDGVVRRIESLTVAPVSATTHRAADNAATHATAATAATAPPASAASAASAAAMEERTPLLAYTAQLPSHLECLAETYRLIAVDALLRPSPQ